MLPKKKLISGRRQGHVLKCDWEAEHHRFFQILLFSKWTPSGAFDFIIKAISSGGEFAFISKALITSKLFMFAFYFLHFNLLPFIKTWFFFFIKSYCNVEDLQILNILTSRSVRNINTWKKRNKKTFIWILWPVYFMAYTQLHKWRKKSSLSVW